MLDPDTQLDYANGLLRRLGCDTRLDSDRLSHLLSVSKDSQESLRKNKPALMADMRAQVSEAVNYADIKTLLYDAVISSEMSPSQMRSTLRLAV